MGLAPVCCTRQLPRQPMLVFEFKVGLFGRQARIGALARSGHCATTVCSGKNSYLSCPATNQRMILEVALISRKWHSAMMLMTLRRPKCRRIVRCEQHPIPFQHDLRFSPKVGYKWQQQLISSRPAQIFTHWNSMDSPQRPRGLLKYNRTLPPRFSTA
ncbi:hypothetical protein Mal52_04200 [Symmachiella dynata]|uniref:Uncharacterized protein n=1 Tax=Symmachiella dynata TaxID=2527995 RepID=A0A517ZHL6_9PLAN|nr:hypothetical protein Mal52_04200 [Symmachiella dynata]